MPPILSKETEHNFNRVCEDYLHILDSYQQGLYNVRIIHHVIWRALRPSSIVLHHRAGSRVERQLRMLQSNGSSDVDYKFEVSGIQVDVSKSNSPNMYFKASCECSDAKNAYGILYVPSSLKTALLSNDKYKRIFNDTFRISSDSKAEFILRPDIFKENVVGECGFQIKRGSQKKTSPSIAVKGAKNETDAVPCLKLNNWTNDALLWVTRDPVFPMFNIKWKQRIVDKMSLYVVPTGNKRSQQFEIEWRLSFVFVEKACFDRIAEYKPRIRHLFGLAKFIFKCCLEELDIFSSYHLKTVLFWKCETKPAESWDSIKPLSFILELISSLETCLDTTTIKHFFIPDCNIFPFDKLDENSVGEIRRRFASVKEVMMERIMTTIAFDLKVNGTLEMSEWIREIDTILKTRKEQGIDEGYISGYLTRLHSMIVHSLLENHRAGTLKESVNALQNILLEERDGSSLCDELVERMIPMLAPSIHTLSEKIYINSGFCQFRKCIERVSSNEEGVLQLDNDQLSNLKGFEAFECYLRKDFIRVKEILRNVSPCSHRDRSIGLTLSKLHRDYYLDPVLEFMILHWLQRTTSSNRLFIEPIVMVTHLNIQLEIRNDGEDEKGSIRPPVQALLRQLHSLVESSSVGVPYIGSLSYRHTGTVMMMAYHNLFSKENICPFPEVPSDSSIVSIKEARNFDLR